MRVEGGMLPRHFCTDVKRIIVGDGFAGAHPVRLCGDDGHQDDQDDAGDRCLHRIHDLCNADEGSARYRGKENDSIVAMGTAYYRLVIGARG